MTDGEVAVEIRAELRRLSLLPPSRVAADSASRYRRLGGVHGSVSAGARTAPVAIGTSLRSKPGSVSVAIADYYGSQSFRSLTGGTPAIRRSTLERFREKYGHKPLASLPREFIVTLLDTMAPHAAKSWLKAFRHFIRWAETRKLVRSDPTCGLRLKMPKSDGHHTWTEDEVAAFEAYHPTGSKPRLALALGLYTAQRRGDVIRMGPQHIKGGVLSVRQQKTAASLAIPVHPQLAAILDASPAPHLTFLVTKNGKSYTAPAFTEMFNKWCDDAGLPDACVFHGLRKLARTATRRSRLHRARDHGDYRPQDALRGRALHRGRGSGADGPQCDGEDENKSGRKVSNPIRPKCQTL